MTPLTRKPVRVTTTKHRGDPIVVELHATALFVRTKGSRESFPIPYSDLYEFAAGKRKPVFPRLARRVQ
jgi:hypothetical protein